MRQGFRTVCAARPPCAVRIGCVSYDSTRTVEVGPAETLGARHRRPFIHAYDFNIVVPHSKGSLAALAEELGREKINIEGLCAVEQNGSVIFHVLTTDKAATSRAIAKVGYKVTRESHDC